MLMIKTMLVAVVLVMGLGACAGPKPQPENATVCSEPRRPMCTREYRPVCGVTEDGTMKTYGNGCDACAIPSVGYFTPEPCENDPTQNLRPGRPVAGG